MVGSYRGIPLWSYRPLSGHSLHVCGLESTTRSNLCPIVVGTVPRRWASISKVGTRRHNDRSTGTKEGRNGKEEKGNGISNGEEEKDEGKVDKDKEERTKDPGGGNETDQFY